MRKIFWIAGLILLVGLACEKKGEPQQKDKNIEKLVETEKPAEPKPIESPRRIIERAEKVVAGEQTLTGEVRYNNLEGGFYELVADGGERYDPVNLPDEYKKDGLRVKFQIREKRDMVGIHMVGKIVEVVKIEKL
jgi:hypothetical protein